MEKDQTSEWPLYREFNIPILGTSTALYSSSFAVANLFGHTFASVSSSDSYSPAFKTTKNHLERTPTNFRCRQHLLYNCDFDMFELKRALSSAHNTSPGPDGISYELLHHLNEDSLVSLLYLFNRIWREQVYPTQWQDAIGIPILKPGKDPKNPLSYRPIALTSCLCKTLERMVNARFVYQLEKNRCIPLFQSDFFDSSLDDHKFSCLMRLEYRIVVLCSLTGVESWSIGSQNSVVVEIVGFSDIGSAAEVKRKGDDKVMETEESIPYILYWLWYPDVEIGHFSNSILHIVVYGQIDSYDKVFLLLDTLGI
ncbi:putative RNA-directed DNA polymerase from transposon X-element [Trichonephila clavipes]|nr:putative RNA-directed DNA polymerase from transposon X-element [Trichonephila clavipes]